MAKSSVYRKHSDKAVDFNMTPMIDVTFQLILFFILTGQVASQALAKMELARPDVSQAIKADEADSAYKVIVNVLATGGVDEKDPYRANEAAWYQVGSAKIEVGDFDTLVKIIADRMNTRDEKDHEKFFVEVRADRRVRFGGVEPVLAAAARAGVQKMNITAQRQLADGE